MFGDIGHGTMLFMFASFLCLQQDFLKIGALKPFLPYRFLLLLMGFFAMFCGWIYNDMMSLPIEKYDTCIEYDEYGGPGEFKEDCVYPFGIDPYWYVSTNRLTFFNSLKMKISVILGVSQMLLGICMKAMNSIYFKRKLDLYFEFIPQITLMLCLFGWMDLLIIVKWLTPWNGNSSRAPGIVTTMISMFLNFGSIDTGTTDSLIGSPMIQQCISIFLLLVALICIPMMLLVKPLILYQEMKHQHKNDDSKEYIELQNQDDLLSPEEEKSPQVVGDKQGDITFAIQQQSSNESHDIGEIFIHQLIETIEFALGTVSNTASYLRLWALSLAHGQLADVFFEKLLRSLALSGGGSSILLFLLFPIFASFSFFVLMCMDSMECFLHTLRLHWVEFQNKFYKGNGFKFVPFSFSAKLEEEINNSYTPNIIIQENEDENVLDFDDNSQELKPTIDQVRKDKDDEDDKQDDDEEYEKTQLYNDLRK